MARWQAMLQRCGRLHRTLDRQHRHRRHGRDMAHDPIVFCPGGADTGNRTGGGARRRGKSRRNRTLRLPEHDGHLTRLPRRLPRACSTPVPATFGCGRWSMPRKPWPAWCGRTNCTPTTSCRVFRFPGGACYRGGGRARRRLRRARRGERSRQPTSPKNTRRFVYEGRLRPHDAQQTPTNKDLPGGSARAAPATRRCPRDPQQDPDPRPPHPEPALRAAGCAGAGRTRFAKTRPRSTN